MTSEPSPHQLLNPGHWKAPKGYANGVAASGRLIYVGGQVGWTGQEVFEAKDLVGQTRQALENIRTILAEAGGGPQHVTRLTWYVLDKKQYLASLPELGKAYRDVMGRHFPAMTLVQVVALVEDEALVEIEATAVIP